MTTDVIILCGGQGTRLQSVVRDKQKCIAEVSGRPFLLALIEHISTFGFKRFILCTGHLSETVQETLKSVPDELDIVISEEKTPLGTGGAVKQAMELVQTNTCLVLNGDSFCAVPLDGFLDFHAAHHALLSIALTQVEDKQDFGTVYLNEMDQITSFGEKAGGGSGLVNAGVYLFKKEAGDHMPDAQKFSLEKDLFPKLCRQGLYGYKTSEPLFDIGTPERLQLASELLKW